jgi:RNA polymerase sigma-70 factor (ECF subfamily)
MEEEELVKELKKGNREIEEFFIKKYSPFLFNVVFQVTRRRNLSEDIVEDAFLIAFRDIGKFKSNSSLSTWLYRIAVNRAKYVLFRSERQREWEKDAVEKGLSETVPEEYKKDSKKEIIWKGMEYLSEQEREIITLIDIEGLHYNEASKLLGTPVGTVRSRINRARTHLKDVILRWNFFKGELSNK